MNGEQSNINIYKDEIYRALNSLALNKTPGNDGLPVEFYVENWDIISDEIVELYSTILNEGYLGKSQRKGIIILIPKSRDELSLLNYRPISLLCTDYKILSKIFAERIKSVLKKVIHNKQFCGMFGQ